MLVPTAEHNEDMLYVVVNHLGDVLMSCSFHVNMYVVYCYKF